MTITTHATMGAVIGVAVGHPVLGFILGFLSHLLIDMIPHGDSGISDNYRVRKVRRKHALAYVTTDAILAILVVLLLANTRDIFNIRAFTFGIAGAVMPDLLVGIYEITKTPLLRWFNTLHFRFHNFFINRHGDVPIKYALLGQMAFVFLLQRWI